MKITHTSAITNSFFFILSFAMFFRSLAVGFSVRSCAIFLLLWSLLFRALSLLFICIYLKILSFISIGPHGVMNEITHSTFAEQIYIYNKDKNFRTWNVKHLIIIIWIFFFCFFRSVGLWRYIMDFIWLITQNCMLFIEHLSLKIMKIGLKTKNCFFSMFFVR